MEDKQNRTKKIAADPQTAAIRLHNEMGKDSKETSGSLNREPVPAPSGTNCCYMLRCSDNSLYTGWTNDLPKRVKNHQAGRGAKYTKAKLPVNLVYYETFATKEEAMKREYAIKQMTRRQKEALICQFKN